MLFRVSDRCRIQRCFGCSQKQDSGQGRYTSRSTTFDVSRQKKRQPKKPLNSFSATQACSLKSQFSHLNMAQLIIFHSCRTLSDYSKLLLLHIRPRLIHFADVQTGSVLHLVLRLRGGGRIDSRLGMAAGGQMYVVLSLRDFGSLSTMCPALKRSTKMLAIPVTTTLVARRESSVGQSPLLPCPLLIDYSPLLDFCCFRTSYRHCCSQIRYRQVRVWKPRFSMVQPL